MESDSGGDDDDEHEINEETGEKVRIKKSDSAGPWNKIVISTNDEEDPVEESNEQKKAPVKKEEDSKASKASYVPPHLRGGSSSSDGDRRVGPGGRMNRGGKNAPEMNQINFPSLSDSTAPKEGSKETHDYR